MLSCEPPHPQIHTTVPSPSTLPGYLGLIGNIRGYLHFKVLMQHFPQSYYRHTDFLTCVLTSGITQSVWTAISPPSCTPPDHTHSHTHTNTQTHTHTHTPSHPSLSRQVSTVTFASLLDCRLYCRELHVRNVIYEM